MKNQNQNEINYCKRGYLREFRESEPCKNFHFNLGLFIVMKTSEKSQNYALVNFHA